MMAAVFVLFIVEMWLNAKTGGHTHGGATGQEFGADAPGFQEAMNNPLKRTNSYDSQKTMAMADEKKGWVENS